jgi:hypothetical protein
MRNEEIDEFPSGKELKTGERMFKGMHPFGFLLELYVNERRLRVAPDAAFQYGSSGGMSRSEGSRRGEAS